MPLKKGAYSYALSESNAIPMQPRHALESYHIFPSLARLITTSTTENCRRRLSQFVCGQLESVTSFPPSVPLMTISNAEIWRPIGGRIVWRLLRPSYIAPVHYS